jgi:CBS domain containing-hemolysin-like protein
MADQDFLRLLFQIAGFIVVMTIAKVVASTAGTRYAEHALKFTSYILVGVRTIAIPVQILHQVLLKFTQHQSGEEEAREELEAFVESAREEGALDAGEYRIMTNIMRLSSIVVGDVMTPRTVVFGLPMNTTVEDTLKKPELQMYSRFPVFEGNDTDSVVGYVIAKDVLRAALAERKSVEVGKLRRPVHYIPENITLERALEQFLQQRQHMFMVVDEHGGVEGLITMEDVMETMLGAEIVDEADHVVDLRQLAKQRRDTRIAQREAQIQPADATSSES